MNDGPRGRGIAGLNTVPNPKLDRLTQAAGRLVVNFGNLETQTYFFLSLLRGTEKWPHDLVGKNKKGFVHRVNMVLEALDQSDRAAHIVADARDSWEEAKELAKYRNSVLHSPVIESWGDGPADGPPKMVGFADVGSATEGKAPNIPAESVEKLYAEVANVVERIIGNYEKLKKTHAKAESSDCENKSSWWKSWIVWAVLAACTVIGAILGALLKSANI